MTPLIKPGTPWWFRDLPEHAACESIVLRTHDERSLRAVCWISKLHPHPRVGIVITHPRLDFTHHYSIPRLLASGFCVLGAVTRGHTDPNAEYEGLLLDVAACVGYLRHQRDCEKVVLLGNSAGGSLAAYYQAEARLEPALRTKTSPSGHPSRLDVADLFPADVMVYAAAHRGDGRLLLDGIDPSVTDERDPLSLDPTLDLYDERNGYREPPGLCRYSSEFLARYREAQLGRVHRIDQLAHTLVDQQKRAGDETALPTFGSRSYSQRRDLMRRHLTDPVMVVYRTVANPNYVDLTLEPSPREYGCRATGRPDLLNYAAAGYARACTPRAWLSTWSGLSSQADLCANVERIQEPSLLVVPTRDREVLPEDVHQIWSAMAAPVKKKVELDARHLFETAATTDQLLDCVIPWIHEHTA